MLLSITRQVIRKLGLVLAWSAALAGLFAVQGWGPAIADPTDDFSFSLLFSPSTRIYHLMSEKQVTLIFRDRMDLLSQGEARLLARHLLQLCHKFRFDPAFVLALIDVESGFRSQVRSSAGAIGLMQIMPATAQVVARDLDRPFSSIRVARRALKDPFLNLSLGVAYLASLRDSYILDRGLSPYYVLAAYNMGPARVDQLIQRKSFKAIQTRKYFEAIRRGVPEFRFYRTEGRDAPRAT